VNNEGKALDVRVRRGSSLELLLIPDDGIRWIRRGMV